MKSDTQRNNDFQEVVASINDFIKVGFNREHEQVKGKYKVTALSSKTLPLVVIAKAYLEVKPLNLKRFEQAPMYLHGKKLYTLRDVNNRTIPRRVQKSITRDYLDAGFKLKHDDKLDRVARWWYQCRVVYSGPEEFCRELLLGGGENLDPANVSKELFERAQNQLRKSKEAHQNQNTRHYLLRGYAYCGICGSPLVGHTMNRRYPYYVCRATMPTSTKVKTCNARSIKAPSLENIVWYKVKSILSNPDIVMSEIKKQSEILKTKSNSGSFDKDIECLERQLKDYDNQEKHLVGALQMAVFTENIVLDKMNQLKHDRQDAIKNLVEIQNIKQKLSTLEYAELQLPSLQDVITRIEHCSDDEKRLAFEALNIHVQATSEKIEIQAIIPIDITATQSSDKQDDVTHHCTNIGITTCK